MRLRTKYALALLAILVVLGTVVLGSAELFKRQTIAQEQTDLNETTELAAGQVGAEVSDRVDVIRRRAAAGGQGTFDNSTQVLRRIVDNHEFYVAVLIDKNGRIVDIQGDIPREIREGAINKSVTEYKGGIVTEDTAEGALTQGVRIGAPQDVPNSSDYILNVAAPISVQQNNTVSFEGAIIGGLFVKRTRLFSALAPLNTSTQTARVTAVTDNDTQATLMETRQTFSNPLSSSATVARTGWTVTVERDRSTLTDELAFLQYLQFGSLFVVFLSVFGLGYYQYRTTLQQTDKLLTGFGELTKGNFDYSLTLSAAEEWDQIGDGFNQMTKDLRERERQIRERERRLSVLNRVLRHNLQNDMTVIQGYAEVLPTMESREEREGASEKILSKSRGLVNHGRKARRLETIMENAEEGTVALEIGQKIREYVRSYEQEFPDVTVEMDGPEKAWVEAVSGIEFGIEQLLDNAFEHNTSDDPRVEVTIETDNETVTIRVRDNGPGIPEHEKEVLTQDEETSLEHGSGIGLWLAYWAVVKSDGELEFMEPDEGSCVVVTLAPAEPPETDEEAEDESESTELNL